MKETHFCVSLCKDGFLIMGIVRRMMKFIVELPQNAIIITVVTSTGALWAQKGGTVAKLLLKLVLESAM